jgi:hypothetical protein
MHEEKDPELMQKEMEEDVKQKEKDLAEYLKAKDGITKS